jgi:hypothetical protein
MFLLGLGLCGIMLGLGALLRPSNPHPGKLTTYECGEPPSGIIARDARWRGVGRSAASVLSGSGSRNPRSRARSGRWASCRAAARHVAAIAR